MGLGLLERNRITVGYRPNGVNVGGIGHFYAATTTFDLRSRFSLDVEIDYYDLTDPMDASYACAETALEYDSGALLWRLSYVTSDGGAREFFDASTVRSRLVAAVSVGFQAPATSSNGKLKAGGRVPNFSAIEANTMLHGKSRIIAPPNAFIQSLYPMRSSILGEIDSYGRFAGPR